MLVCCWSPKGGSGTSVFAAACALTLAREHEGVRLADLDGDQPSILGLAADPATGLREWLAVGVEAPADALDRLAVAVSNRVTLLPAGGADLARVAPEAGAALGVALRAHPAPTIVDIGVPTTPAHDALLELADANLVVLRGCYLALRRAVRMAAYRTRRRRRRSWRSPAAPSARATSPMSSAGRWSPPWRCDRPSRGSWMPACSRRGSRKRWRKPARQALARVVGGGRAGRAA